MPSVSFFFVIFAPYLTSTLAYGASPQNPCWLVATAAPRNSTRASILSVVASASYSATRTTAYTSCTSVRRSVVAASRPAASPASFSRPTAASSASLPESPSFATAKTASLAAHPLARRFAVAFGQVPFEAVLLRCMPDSQGC